MNPAVRDLFDAMAPTYHDLEPWYEHLYGLLHAILERVEQRQPVAAPNNVRRYFISHTEAAELCLLSGFLGETAEIFVPRLDPARQRPRALPRRRPPLSATKIDRYQVSSIATKKESRPRPP